MKKIFTLLLIVLCAMHQMSLAQNKPTTTKASKPTTVVAKPAKPTPAPKAAPAPKVMPAPVVKATPVKPAKVAKVKKVKTPKVKTAKVKTPKAAKAPKAAKPAKAPKAKKSKPAAASASVATPAATSSKPSVSLNGPLLRGDRLYGNFDFKNAAYEYKRATEKDPASLEAKEKLVRTYLMLNDYVSAEPVLEQLSKAPNAKAYYKLLYGQTLRSNSKYKEAADAFNEYLVLNPSDSRASELANTLSAMQDLAKGDGTHKVQVLTSENSPSSEMGVGFFKDNNIIFSSNKGANPFVGRTDNWTGSKYYDMYTAKNGKVEVTDKKLNMRYHEGPAAFNSTFSEMYFTRDNYTKNKVGKSKDRISKLKMFVAKVDSANPKGGFGKEVELPFNSSEYSVAHPTLSKDGKRLYFISDMPGGYGETDLYVSFKENDKWGPAINLGKGVNTPGREMFPFISNDGTLYFASDSRVGLGGLDVYAASYSKGEWGGATNLGSPINSNADDFGYIINEKGTTGYLVSNRTGGQGDDDIYSFTRQGVKICGEIVDANTNLTIPGATVKLYSADVVIATKTAGTKGEFCFTGDLNKEYKIEGSYAGYDSNSAVVTLKLNNPKVIIPLTPTKPVVAEKEPIKAAGPTDEEDGLTDKNSILLTVCAKERNVGNLAGADIEVENKTTGKIKTCVTGPDCKCDFRLQPNTEYFISVSKKEYSTATRTISTKGKKAGTKMFEELTLERLKTGVTIRLDNIYYDLDKSFIRKDAAKELDNLVKLLNQNPKMEIELSSHTDSRASDQYNVLLSARRAKACVEYLAAKGVDVRRLLAVGYGELKLTNKCSNGVKCTDAEHQSNRRTEFKVLKME